MINDPTHPYTQLLVSSIPQPDPETQWGREQEARDEDEAADTGCNFYDRCPLRMDECTVSDPPLYRTAENRITRCYRYADSPVHLAPDLRSVFAGASSN